MKRLPVRVIALFFYYYNTMVVELRFCRILLPVVNLAAVLEMEEIDDGRETVSGKGLVSVFEKTEGHLSDEGCPATVAAKRPHDEVAARQGVEIKDCTGRLSPETTTVAASELV